MTVPTGDGTWAVVAFGSDGAGGSGSAPGPRREAGSSLARSRASTRRRTSASGQAATRYPARSAGSARRRASAKISLSDTGAAAMRTSGVRGHPNRGIRWRSVSRLGRILARGADAGRLAEPGPGEGPVAIGRGPRDAEHFRRLVDGQAGKELEAHQFGRRGVLPRELRQRVVDHEPVDGGTAAGVGDQVEVDAVTAAAPLTGLGRAGMIDQHPPHRLGRRGKELAAVVPGRAVRSTDEAQIRFVD